MKIVWTKSAELSYVEEIEFINRKWSLVEVAKFMDLVDVFVNKLKSGIIEGKVSPKTNIRSFVISRQTTLFFDFQKDKKRIELLLFWNNKRNPKELEKQIKKFYTDG